MNYYKSRFSSNSIKYACILGLFFGMSSFSFAQNDCKPAHENIKTINPGELNVAVFAETPYTIPQKGEPSFTGIDGEIIARFAKEECLKLVENGMDATAMLQIVMTGRADIGIGGVAKIKEREDKYGMTKTIYYTSLAFVSKDGYETLDDLKDISIGVVAGYRWNPSFIDMFGVDNVMIYQTSDGLLLDVINDRIDVGIFDIAEAKEGLKQKNALDKVKTVIPEPDPRNPFLEHTEATILYTKGNTSLGQALDDQIQKMIDDGFIKGLLERYDLDPALAAK